MEFRGHDHVIETVVFAPVAAYPAIRELAGLPVKTILILSLFMIFILFSRVLIDQSDLVHLSPQVHETSQLNSGTSRVDKCYEVYLVTTIGCAP